MRKIAFRPVPSNAAPGTSLKDFLVLVLSNSPQKGVDPGEMRKRVAVLDKLDGFDGASLILEDAEHAMLKTAIETFPWAMANKTLLNLIDDIAAAAPYPLPKETDAEPQQREVKKGKT